MTDADLITRARKEWCEVQDLGDEYGYGAAESSCPPEVVAALLAVLESGGCDCPEGSLCPQDNHTDYCNIRIAEYAIEKALEV